MDTNNTNNSKATMVEIIVTVSEVIIPDNLVIHIAIIIQSIIQQHYNLYVKF